ncbi:DUF421 domain-containing protein [Rubricoccus marinus]|uniref:YetF C-terminal domain-containing protein n=1 Tax=Rubricoccus marinus TaxID=716817 RepID=A0A259U2C4_9BACT|nr:YetF domain-containing protein [Rubricoccus marinus]OZC04121.1 hypothetical protein BSZ36_14700 [Rubricoccus marinus]
MDAVLRGVAVYAFLVLVFSALGRRTLVQTTNFDLVLVIIIGQSTQLALLGDDYSVTNAFLLIVTLLGAHLGLAAIKSRLPRAQRWLGGGPPLIVVENGYLLETRAASVGVGQDDVLLAARELHGLERMDQVAYAIVERTGAISIVPRA